MEQYNHFILIFDVATVFNFVSYYIATILLFCYSVYPVLLFCYLMQEFKPEFMQPFLYMKNSCLLTVNI